MASPDPSVPLFRPNKKRKIYRQRAAEEDEDITGDQSPPPQSLDELIASASQDAKAEALSVAEILRLRKQRKARTGVEFRPAGNTRDEEQRIVQERHEGIVPAARFAPQTGMVGDVNKHMMAYIDSELAKRHTAEVASGTLSASDMFVKGGSNLEENKLETSTQRKDSKDIQRQPAAMGKLMEIDLGDEARDRNVQLTERARRKLEGEEDIEDEDSKKPVKIRLGPDGKPWRSKKKRRGSDDVKRDRLVEDILRENRLELYDEQAPQPQISDDQAADDRIAEEFRREFMDSQKQKKKPIPGPPPSRNPAKRKEEEEMKGPKLGGSRSARAAMKEAMAKQGKK